MDLKFPKPRNLIIAKLKMPCLIEEKIDGQRLMLWKKHAYGRNQDSLGRWINKWDKLPKHIQKQATKIPIDGEIYWPGKEASDVSTGLKEKNDELQFIGFYIADENLYPHEHLLAIQALGIPTPRVHFIVGKSDYFAPSLISKDFLLDKAKRLNVEGWILKERYKIPVWWRVKCVDTYDLIVTDLRWPLAGRNKQKGWIKSLTCSAYVDGELKVVANVSGMTDEVRSKISKKDIGKIVEVKANLLASQGKLKHPRFIRWRYDKNAKKCELNT